MQSDKINETVIMPKVQIQLRGKVFDLSSITASSLFAYEPLSLVTYQISQWRFNLP